MVLMIPLLDFGSIMAVIIEALHNLSYRFLMCFAMFSFIL